jgi:hypothetical protein
MAPFKGTMGFSAMKYLMFDLRALALMRVCVAIVILLDLSVRVSDLEVFYANSGAVPMAMVFEHTWNKYFISFHAVNGMWQFQLLLFLLSYFFAAMLLIGYRTRLFTVLAWVMMLSLHNRNTLILQGGDDLLRMVLFWGMFIPWGARYSCDALMGSKKLEPVQFLNVATIAYLLQICYIYTGSALLKGKEWSSDFTAMYYVYGLDQIAYPITKHLFYHPSLLRLMTIAAYYFELLVPLLFFIPVAHQWFRYAGVLLIVFFHGFNTVTLLIGMFPLIGIATVMGMLPTVAMDHFERLCAFIRSTVRDSLLAWSGYLQHILKWKETLYEYSPVRRNLQNAMLIFLTLFVFDWNFSNLTFINSKLSDSLRPIGYALRLDQNWGMFAPGVFKDDGWYVYEGKTEKGECFDLLCPDKKISYKKPASVTAMFKNDRWRKYTENLMLAYNSYMRGYFTSYYMRTWNENNQDRQIKELQIVYMSEFTQPDYKIIPAKKEVLWVYK